MKFLLTRHKIPRKNIISESLSARRGSPTLRYLAVGGITAVGDDLTSVTGTRHEAPASRVV